MRSAAALVIVGVLLHVRDGLAQANVTKAPTITTAGPVQEMAGPQLSARLSQAVGIVSVPIIAMVSSCILALYRQPDIPFSVVFHYFAGGLILSAIAVELVPLLSSARWWSIGIGFGIALVVMAALAAVSPDEEEECCVAGSQVYSRVKKLEADEAELSDNNQVSNMAYFRTGGNHSNGADEVSISLQEVPLADSNHDTLKLIESENSQNFLLALGKKEHSFSGVSLTRGIPLTTVLAVSCDAMVDGLCLGISSGVGVKEGTIVAIAMTIEMVFTGAALSYALNKSQLSSLIKIAIVVVVPQFMLVGGIIGAYFHYSLEPDSQTFASGVAFCVAVLLYLAVIELIGEARELQETLSGAAKQCAPFAMFFGFAMPMMLNDLV